MIVMCMVVYLVYMLLIVVWLKAGVGRGEDGMGGGVGVRDFCFTRKRGQARGA